MNWWYVFIFSAFSWGFLAVAARFKAGKASSLINWTGGILSLTSALIAGDAARDTWIGTLVEKAIGISPVLGYVLGAFVVLATFWTFLVVSWDSWSGVAASVGIAAAWVLIPSLLEAGVPPAALGGDVMFEVATRIADFSLTTFLDFLGWLRGALR